MSLTRSRFPAVALCSIADLELYPFIDSLWYGEGFDYETASPAYWLAEMSGIPHGLNADLLRYALTRRPRR